MLSVIAFGVGMVLGFWVGLVFWRYVEVAMDRERIEQADKHDGGKP